MCLSHIRVLYRIVNYKGSLVGFKVWFADNKQVGNLSLREIKPYFIHELCDNVTYKNDKQCFVGLESPFRAIPATCFNSTDKPAFYILSCVRKASNSTPAVYKVLDGKGRIFTVDTNSLLKALDKQQVVNAFMKNNGNISYLCMKRGNMKEELENKSTGGNKVSNSTVGTTDTNSRMRYLIDILNKASDTYYNSGKSIMSDQEYDKLYDELVVLEKSTGCIYGDSPTQKVGATVVSSLAKVKHRIPSLSLDKTKDVSVFANSLGGKLGMLNIKEDGLTGVAIYEKGELVSLATRGNGTTGEDITHNAPMVKGLPKVISYKDTLIVRGELLISYKDFERVNNSLPIGVEPYKNPRNLASGTARLLDSKDVKSRGLSFVVFSVAEGFSELNSHFDKLMRLNNLGFKVVPSIRVMPQDIPNAVKSFAEKVKSYEYPSDGLVLTIDDIKYGELLGTTAKFPRNAMAFKWKDETYTTTLRGIDWSVSRTGVITPVAEFDAVDIDGASVRRASVHNISIMKSLKLGIGDQINVFRANMVIPQILDNLTGSGTIVPPKVCPICGQPTVIKKDKDTEVLVCTGSECPAKFIGFFEHMVDKSALNVMGISSNILELLINAGMLREPRDLFMLSEAKIKAIEALKGKAGTNLLKSIEKARNTTFEAFLVSLSIPLVGKTISGKVARVMNYDINTLCDFQGDASLGNKVSQNIVEYFQKTWNGKSMKVIVKDYASMLSFAAPLQIKQSAITGKSICITGSLGTFNNRKEFEDYVRSYGGNLVSSVSSKTDILVTNDTTSGSSKNVKAAQLGIPVMSELDFKKYVEV